MLALKRNYRFVLVIGLLTTLLLFSLVLNYYLFDRCRQYYLQLNETRLDPLGLGLGYYTMGSTLSDSIHRDKATVVFFGDSRAAAWPAPLHLDRFEFVNYGVGSQTSGQVVHRFDYHVEPLRPHVIVLQVGINDLKTIPLFPNRQEAIVASCKANLRRIVTRSIDLGATVILTTVFPIGEVPLERRPFWSDEVAGAIDEVNAYIRSLRDQDVILLDAYAILADGREITQAKYSRDFLHVNAAGYMALNEELARILTNLN